MQCMCVRKGSDHDIEKTFEKPKGPRAPHKFIAPQELGFGF